jgi:hypothetical protein
MSLFFTKYEGYRLGHERHCGRKDWQVAKWYFSVRQRFKGQHSEGDKRGLMNDKCYAGQLNLKTQYICLKMYYNN